MKDEQDPYGQPDPNSWAPLSGGGPAAPSGGPPYTPPYTPPPPPEYRLPAAAKAVVTGAVLLFVLLAVGVFVLMQDSDSDRKPPSNGKTAGALKDAAAKLSASPATRYQGTITSPLGGRLPVDLRVTGKGSTLGTLTVAGERLQLMAVDDKTYVKADKDFWRSSGIPADSLEDYSAQWVKVPPERFGIDLQALLAPSELGRKLAEAATAGSVLPGEPATVDGVPATTMTVQGCTIYVSTAEPRQILRIECSPTLSPPGDTTPSGLFADDFQLDLSELLDSALEQFYESLSDKVSELDESIDSQIRFTLDGQVTLSPCNTSGCTARVTLRNRVSSNDESVRANRPVTAVITINMTLDGRPVRTCTETKSMPPNGSTTATCRASYHIPPSTRPRTHRVEALARAVARTVAAADIKRIIADLEREKDAYKP